MGRGASLAEKSSRNRMNQYHTITALSDPTLLNTTAQNLNTPNPAFITSNNEFITDYTIPAMQQPYSYCNIVNSN